MATTFARPTLEATLDAVVACGVQSVQFDLACAGVPTLPAQITPALCARVRDAFAARWPDHGGALGCAAPRRPG
jgi:hypothetical protein